MAISCAVSIKQVIGPFYFERTIINSDSLLSLLNKVFHPVVPSLPLGTIFQRDGAPPHYRITVRHLLDVYCQVHGQEECVLYRGQYTPQI